MQKTAFNCIVLARGEGESSPVHLKGHHLVCWNLSIEGGRNTRPAARDSTGLKRELNRWLSVTANAGGRSAETPTSGNHGRNWCWSHRGSWARQTRCWYLRYWHWTAGLSPSDL